jgi:tetratricopeptide (TPR) repeat protein
MYFYDKNIPTLAQYRLAQIYIEQKEYQKSLDLLEKIIPQTDSTDFYAGLASYYIWKNDENQDIYAEKIEKYWKNDDFNIIQYKFEMYLKQKKYEQIYTQIDKLLTKKINNTQFQQLFSLGLQALYEDKKYQKLLSFYKKNNYNNKLNLNKNQIYMLGIAHYQCNEKENALKYFEQVGEDSTQIGQQSAYLAGKLNIENENFAEGILWIWQASSLNFDVEIQKSAKENLKELENYLTKKLTPKDTSHTLNTQLSEWLEKKQYAEATQFLEIFITQNNTADKQKLAKFWLAEIYLQQNDFQKAISLYKDILHWRNVDNTITLPTHFGLAHAYMKIENYELAITHFQIFIFMNGKENSKDAIVRLADCYLKMKDLNNAKYFYELTQIEKEYAQIQLQNIDLYIKKDENAFKFTNYPIQDPNTLQTKILIIEEKINIGQTLEANYLLKQLSIELGWLDKRIENLWILYWQKMNKYSLLTIVKRKKIQK